MPLVDYKTKIFGFVAENLRRMAEFLTVEAAEKEISAPLAERKSLSPMEDWLEKTRNISPENWVGFSVENQAEQAIPENEPEPETETAKPDFASETDEDFVLEKPEKQTPVKTFFENKRQASKAFEISREPQNSNKTASETEISPAEKTKKPKSGSRFLSFKFPVGKRKEENAETIQPAPEISRQPAESDEKTLVTAKRNFKLFPAETIFKSKSETAESSAPGIISFGENQPPPKFEVPTFERKKSAAIEPEKTTAEKPKNAGEKPEAIFKKSSGRRKIAADRQQLLSTFPLMASRKSDESGDEINFERPKRKTDSAAVAVSPKTGRAAQETPNFPARRKKNEIDAQEYFNPQRNKKTDNKDDNNTDNPQKFAADIAASPWIDLPDETAFFEAADEMQNGFSENEHLRFLEGEQAGKN